MKITNRFILTLTILLFFLITILTQFYGNADIGDYADVAKFFAGEYSAKIRSSHSYFYGLMLSPFVKLTENFLAMKIMTLVWLILIILSLYYISGKDRKTLLLTITAPIFWYMAPIVNPIQIASLLFLWGYYFLIEYNKQESIKFLFYAGIFFGLAWAFWDTILHFGILLTLCFFWNKKFHHLIYFIVFILIGLLPRLILDQILFNFPFYTILKSFTGGLVNSLWAGTLGSGHSSKSTLNIILTLITLPLFSYFLLTPQNFKNNPKTNIFLILSLLLILSNPQPRYTLLIIPIIILNLGSLINKRQLNIYLIFSITFSLIIVTPYLIQIKYSTNSQELTSFISNIRNIEINTQSQEEQIQQDLKKITNKFQNQRFLVGPLSDDYAILARAYWGKQVKEFVSIQDYNLWFKNESVLFEKEFHPIPEINNRREIWIIGGISRRIENYDDIIYAIGLYEPVNYENFELVEKYGSLYLSKKHT